MQVLFDLVNGKQADPLLPLVIIGDDFRVKRFRHSIERDAVVRFDHELLLEPQLLLEILQLRHEGDDFVGDAADHLDLAEVLLHLRG